MGTKKEGGSQLRFTWASNLRAYSTQQSVACYWDLLIDGKNCASPSQMSMAVHTNKNDNDHIPVGMVNWCKGIAAGEHTLTVRLREREAAADCYTGWETYDYMEVWEPTADEQTLITYLQGHHKVDGGENKAMAHRTFTFVKKEANTNVRITYFDNFRTIKHGQWCRWEVRVDNKSCTNKIANNQYTLNDENDHHPGTVIGNCPGLAKGTHTVSVQLNNSGSADCYLGWMTTNMLEVMEMPLL